MTEIEQQAAALPDGLRTRYLLQRPVVVLATTTIVALIGGILLALAADRSNPLVGLAGIVIATGAAWVTTDYTAAKCREPDNRLWKSFVGAAALTGLAMLLMVERMRSELGVVAPVLAFLGLMAMTLVIGPLVGGVRDGAIDEADRWMLGGLVVGLASAVVIGSPVATWVRLLAFIAMLVGFGFLTGGLSTMCAHGALPKSEVLKIVPGDARQRGIVVGAIGIGVLLLGAASGWDPVTAVGAWTTVVAMIMLSVRPVRFGMSKLMKRSVLGAGLVLVAAAGFQLYATDTVGRSGWFATFVAATIALIGAWIVWRGATLFIVVVLGFAFVWGLFPHTTGDPGSVSAASSGDRQTSGIVAFGDSFISGEGAPTFFDGTDQKGAERNECRRAPTAYPVLMADRTAGTSGSDPDDTGRSSIVGLEESGLDFLACSGAKLRDVLALCADDPALDSENADAIENGATAVEPAGFVVAATEQAESTAEDRCSIEAKQRDQRRRADLSCTPADDEPLGQYPCGPDGVYGSSLQLSNPPDDRSATQLVLLSIGGNDVRFGDIVAGCLLPGSCTERREIWLDNVAALGPELTEAYVRIKEEFGGDVPVVVMPYPLVLTDDTCGSSPLDASEHEFIFEFTTVLNRQIATSASQAGVHFFADGAFALEGARLCEGQERAINLIRLQPTDGPLLDRMKPASWTHNSMHPNQLGHRMIADALSAWLDAGSIIGSGNPVPGDAGETQLLDVRTARPHAVAPAVAESLRRNDPAECDTDQIGGFATQIAVFDEQPENGEDAEAFRVPVAGADTESTICVTNSAGEWQSLTPVEVADVADGATSLTRLPSAEPIAEIRGDRVFVSGGRPETCRASDRRSDLCDFQWILFASGDEGDGGARTWSLRAVRYCSVDPDCENTFAEWTDAQIDQAVRRVAPTIGLIFLGGWLLALGVELVFAPRLVRLFRPKFTRSIVRSG